MSPAYRKTWHVAATGFSLVLLWGCVPDSTATPLPIDLLRELPRSERSPNPDPNQLVRVDFVRFQGEPRPALLMRTSSRVIWSVQMLEEAELRADLALLPDSPPGADVTVRVGVSDDRLYDDLLLLTLPSPRDGQPDWAPLTVDLSAYSGRKWSVFHQPSRRIWRVVLNVGGSDGGRAAFVLPRIEARSAPRD